MADVQLGNLKIDVSRPKLKVWIRLEDLREKINKGGGEDNLVLSILSYISLTIVDISIEELENIPWYDILESYNSIVDICTPLIEFPILSAHAKNDDEAAWEYDERTWYMWSNALARSYSWTLEYIAELDVDDAIGLLQEIYTDEQIRKEWEWSLSEIAYPYNKTTEKTEYKPLPRPSWMQDTKDDIMEKIRKIKVDPTYLPVGNVQRWKL